MKTKKAGLVLLIAMAFLAVGIHPRRNAQARRLRADFNGDNFADLAIGVPFEDISSADNGAVNILYGCYPPGYRQTFGLPAAGDALNLVLILPPP